MTAYSRWLFGSAAALNLGVAFGLLLLRPTLSPLLGLGPIAGTNLALLYLTAGFIALFGYAYLRAAIDPAANRPLIALGAIGKLLAVAAVTFAWLTGAAPARLAAATGADLLYAALFADYLRRTRLSGKP